MSLMDKQKTILKSLLFWVIAQTVCAQMPWPVKREIDLASGFGEYRSGRFHAGLDIRTGGVIGEPVFSPVDGYVWRIRTNYEGYGKALYLRGPEDRIYVFAHLNKYVPEIEKIVRSTQIAAERYFVDIYLPPDSVKIKSGQLVAQSGETGAGPPHLHFESRSPDNRPINPLTHGFKLEDQTRPVFERIGFQAADDSSLFDIGLRKVFYKVKRGDVAGEYYLDTVVYFNSPFGVLIDCYDLMRPNGMRSTARKLSLYVDDVLYYESVFDTLNYSTELSSYFEYDLIEAVDDHTRVRRLFAEDGNYFSGSSAKGSFKGYFGENLKEKPGIRTGKIIANDCCDNQSTLTFQFIWGPAENIFNLDSTVTESRDTTKFYFTAIPEYKNFGIDSVSTFLNRADQWGQPDFVKTLYTPDGNIVSTVVTDILRPKLLRLIIFANKECIIRDNIFNGILEQLPKMPGPIAISSDEDGIWVTINSVNKAASKAWVRLYHGDSLLGTKEARLYNMKNYRCLIPPKEEYATVDKFGLVFGTNQDGREVFVDSLKFYAVGYGQREIISEDGHFSMKFTENTLYKPLFVQLKHHVIYNKIVMSLNSDSYEILPEVFRCKEDFVVSCRLLGDLPKNTKSGICWLDNKKNKWVWLSTTFADNVLNSKSKGGGMFAAVIDYDSPNIWNLNVRSNQFYRDPELPIQFVLNDTLSGFEDDRAILIKLDGNWIIPEYDPETNVCTSQPNEPLEAGEHHLGIEVVDRAGNKTEKYLRFKIRSSGR